MASPTVSINRAPVLTLWAAVVAERLGYTEDEALTLGKAVAGLNAHSKGRRLGLFQPPEESPAKARQKAHREHFLIDVCGRPVPATNTPEGVRAVHGDTPIDPGSVRRYLHGKFGEHLDAVRAAMTRLAHAYRRGQLAKAAFPLYERFRPAIPDGVQGWGVHGALDLGLIDRLAGKKE